MCKWWPVMYACMSVTQVKVHLNSMPHTVSQLLSFSLNRLESDIGHDLLTTALSLLACSRVGKLTFWVCITLCYKKCSMHGQHVVLLLATSASVFSAFTWHRINSCTHPQTYRDPAVSEDASNIFWICFCSHHTNVDSTSAVLHQSAVLIYFIIS